MIDPFRDECLGSNSYDVHLGSVLQTYRSNEDRYNWHTASGYGHGDDGAIELRSDGHKPTSCRRRERSLTEDVIDARRPLETQDHVIDPDHGFLLRPGVLYLGSTVEYTETSRRPGAVNLVPFLDGKSSVGRLGVTVHCTAGRGDVGFAGHWTLEIHVVQPVRVYANMAIGQLIYFRTGIVDKPYHLKPNAKYNNRDTKPQASQMWRNFDADGFPRGTRKQATRSFIQDAERLLAQSDSDLSERERYVLVATVDRMRVGQEEADTADTVDGWLDRLRDHSHD